MPGGGKSKEANRRSKNKCSMCHCRIATYVGPCGPGKCTVHGVVHNAAVQATSPQTSSQVSTTLPLSFHSVMSPPQGVQVTSLSCNAQGCSSPSDGVQESTLNQHHSGGSDYFSPPTVVQVSTVNLHPSQHNPMPGTMTSTTNSYVSTTASGSINNTDNHAFQANLDFSVNNMASMQTQLNHVIDMQNVPITGDQNAKQSNYS